MTGSTDDKTDTQNVDFAKICWKKVIIIWTIQKVWVWVDIPMIDSVFLASAIKFRSTVIQAIGRALRKFDWKEKVKVIIWNDVPIYKKQRSEKFKAIKQEYWIEEKEIVVHKIKLMNDHFKPLMIL
jgi:predicted helicase